MPVQAKSIREALTPDRWTVDPETGCWLWNGAVNQKGYGCLYAEGRHVRPHRAAYELAHGPVGADVHVHHVCREPRCVNPGHLEAISRRDHSRLHAAERIGDTCSRGHERTVENTRVSFSGKRGRQIACRVCDREHHRARYHAARAAQ